MRWTTWRRAPAISAWLVMAFFAGRAGATTAPDTCHAGGEGAFCRNTDDCGGNALATACVEFQCEIPCQDAVGARKPTACSLGETCMQGETDVAPVWYCQPSSLAMDLNLLDNCINHFVDGLRPDLTSDNVCSLENNLAQMLDQDANRVFNIFDVDLCIKAFLDNEPCAGGACPKGEVYCDGAAADRDDQCGRGLYCNSVLNRCERECGLVASREDGMTGALERKCSRPLTVCDYDRGRCVTSQNLAGTTCQVDGDCPSGAVCSLGSCAAKCRRSTDCPDSTWYCSTSNRCLPRPTVAASNGFVFDPQGYAVRLASKSVTLTAVDDQASVSLLIMDLISKKQVFSNPAVLFGYRLEAQYAFKQDAKCLKNPIAAADAEDCYVSANEAFVTLGNPFGVVTAQGSPKLTLSLNNVAAAKLSTGMYQATITVFFSNGGQDSFTVSYRKTAPSGEYAGRLSIYKGGPENLLGNTNLSARLFVDSSTTKQWDAMLAEQGVVPDGDIHDITSGYFVTGYIDGNSSMVFDQPAAVTRDQNKIPVRGLYSPQFGRMRLIAAVDIPANFCRTDSGLCGAEANCFWLPPDHPQRGVKPRTSRGAQRAGGGRGEEQEASVFEG